MLLKGFKFLLAVSSIFRTTFAFTFVNPASHGGQISFSKNKVYPEKSALEIEWTVGEEGQDATVTLWQVDLRTSLPTDTYPETLGDFEYLAEGQAYNRNTRNWMVSTEKDFSTSPVFLMMIFVTGATTATDQTVYFNISSSDGTEDSGSTSTSTTASATATTAALVPTSLVNLIPSTTALASGLPSASSTSSEIPPALSPSAKIGLGVGIPVAAVIGVGVGWLAFRRGKAQRNQQQIPGGHPQEGAGFSGYSAETPKPGFGAIAYGSPPSAPGYGPPSNADGYRPPSNAEGYRPPSNAHGYEHRSNAPPYEAGSNTPVYKPASVCEANNDQAAPSELYSPHNTHR